MRVFTVIMVVLLVSACAAAPMQTYRPRGDSGNGWQIDGDFNGFTNSIVIRVNGQEALSGSLSFFQSKAELSGGYQGHALSASCSQSIGLLETTTQCIVFVDNERASTLQF